MAFDSAWKEVVAEESAKNPNFKRVYQSYDDFRDNYATWWHFNYLQKVRWRHTAFEMLQ